MPSTNFGGAIALALLPIGLKPFHKTAVTRTGSGRGVFHVSVEMHGMYSTLAERINNLHKGHSVWLGFTLKLMATFFGPFDFHGISISSHTAPIAILM